MKINNYLKISCLKCETSSKLIDRIPGLGLLISSLPGSDSRTHVESLGLPSNSTCVLEAEPGKLDIKRHSPSILYLSDKLYKSLHSAV